MSRCNQAITWWNGEYEGNCELPAGHDGDHYDGASWWNDDFVCTNPEHVDVLL